MFCFPISDHVMLLEGIVSFKCRANVRMHVQMYVQHCITNEKLEANSHEGITWYEMGKQNIQAKEIYSVPEPIKIAR